MSARPPILTAELFPGIQIHLLDLLRSLQPHEWGLPTVCSQWAVRDIAAHLVDGAFRRLSVQRDGHRLPAPPGGFTSDRDLVTYLHRLNADWTAVARRFSPEVLIDLLELAGKQCCRMYQASDPFAAATFPVSWAGEQSSYMWFDVAREYTEQWHHQRQIALAVGRSTPIDDPQFYHPVLETFLRGMPYHLSGADAAENTTVAMRINGPAGGRWAVQKSGGVWRWIDDDSRPVRAEVIMDQAVAWQVLTKRWDAQRKRQAFGSIELHGDHDLACYALEMVSIMA